MLFFDELGNGDPTVASFQDIIDRELPDLLRCRAILQEKEIEIDEQVCGAFVRSFYCEADVSHRVNTSDPQHDLRYPLSFMQSQ